MKKFLLAAMILLISVQVSYGWTAEITGEVGIYKNKKLKLNEQPVLKLSKGDQVEVLKTSGKKSFVKHYSGKKGWVESSKLRKAQKIGGGKKMTFSGENIMGDLGEIEGVFLFEDDNSVSKGLSMDRSFKEEMNAPEDKEQLERKYTDYIKW